MAPSNRRAPRMAPATRRAAIIEAARPLVTRHGSAVTTRQIAEAAGIAEGTIFRVFPDKESVVQAVVAEVFDPEPTLRDLAAVDRGLPLRERLTAAVTVLQRRLSQVFGLLDALGWIRQPESGEAERRPHPPAGINDAFRAAMVDIVGSDECRLRVPATELAHVLRLLVFSGTHPMIADGRPLTPEQIVTILLDGLYLPTPPAPQAPPASSPRDLPTPPAPQAPPASSPRDLPTPPAPQAPPASVPRSIPTTNEDEAC